MILSNNTTIFFSLLPRLVKLAKELDISDVDEEAELLFPQESLR